MSIRVLAGGCFNSIHPGHIYFLKQAKNLGDQLIVVLTHDKNNKKPYAVSANKRKDKLESLKIADKVIIGDPDDNMKVVNKIRPDIIALGYDQNLLLKGFKVVRLGKFGNYSTNKLK